MRRMRHHSFTRMSILQASRAMDPSIRVICAQATVKTSKEPSPEMTEEDGSLDPSAPTTLTSRTTMASDLGQRECLGSGQRTLGVTSTM